VLTLETVGQRLSDMSLFVAIDETGEIVGTVGCNIINGKEAQIRGMGVRPKWQGAGVRTHLLKSVESALRRMKCTRIGLVFSEQCNFTKRMVFAVQARSAIFLE